MRVVVVALVWLVAVIAALAALFSAYVGRADFGGGGADIMPVPEAALLVGLAIGVLVLAGWLTRRLLR